MTPHEERHVQALERIASSFETLIEWFEGEPAIGVLPVHPPIAQIDQGFRYDTEYYDNLRRIAEALESMALENPAS